MKAIKSRVLMRFCAMTAPSVPRKNRPVTDCVYSHASMVFGDLLKYLIGSTGANNRLIVGVLSAICLLVYKRVNTFCYIKS